MTLLEGASGISFPGLSIEFEAVPGEIGIFGLQISLQGIFIFIGTALFILLSLYAVKRSGQKPDDYIGLFVFGIIATLFGARFIHFLTDFGEYEKNILSVLNPAQGGFSLYGGMLFAFLTITAYSKLKKMNMFVMLDTLSEPFLLGIITGKLGQFFSRSGFGRFYDGLFAMKISVNDAFLSSIYKPLYVTETELTNRFSDKPQKLAEILEIRKNIMPGAESDSFISVHPLFLYEAALLLLTFIVLLFLRKRTVFEGELFYYMLTAGASIRFFCSFLGRSGYERYIMPAVVVLAVGVIIYYRKKERAKETK